MLCLTSLPKLAGMGKDHPTVSGSNAVRRVTAWPSNRGLILCGLDLPQSKTFGPNGRDTGSMVRDC